MVNNSINGDKYINLLTDFGFKRLFGNEPHKALLIDFLNAILPAKHTIADLSYKNNENVGNTLMDRKAIFEIAEIAKFSPEEQRAYENSLKYYRDLNNVIETSKQEGREEGKEEGKEEGIILGIEKGITIGREEEKLLNLERQRSLLLRQLSRKLGEIPNSITTQVNQLSRESTETLSEILFDFNSIEDLRNWLDNDRD